MRIFVLLSICAALTGCANYSDDPTADAAALAILGAGLQNAAHTYYSQPYYIPQPTTLHCFGSGAYLNCQQW